MKPISKGKFNIKYGLLFSVISIGMVAVTYYIFNSAFSTRFIQIEHLIAAIIFTLFFLYIFFLGGREYKAVDIYESYIKMQWLWGLFHYKLKLDEIKLFSLSTKNKAEYLILRSVKYDFLLQPSLTNNHIELIEQLKSWKIKRRDNIYFKEISRIETRAGGIILMLLGAFIFIIAIRPYLTDYSSINKDKLVTLTGTLQSTLNIKSQSLRSSSQYISFHLKEYPEYAFMIDGIGYEAVNTSRLNDYKQGTIVKVKIPAREFHIKISSSAQPTPDEKHFNWTTINVYEAYLDSEKILTLDEYNFQSKNLYESNRKYGWLTIGLSIALFIYGIKCLSFARKRVV